MVISVNISLFLISKKCKRRYCSKTTNENKQVEEIKTWLSNSYIVVNRALSSLHVWPLEITLTVPLTIGNLTWGQDLVENNECVSEYVVMYR